MNTVVNRLTTMKTYMRVNRTKEDETLYYLPDASLLVIVPPEKKTFHYVFGDTSDFLYKKLAVDTEKRKKCEGVYMMRLLNFFYAQIDENADDLETMARLEEILDKIE